jgi:uncharacterized protein (TIRG00374 family)
VSALAVYYLLQQVSVDQLGQVLGRSRPLPVVLLVLTVLGSLATRAARWQVYFLPDRRVPYASCFGTLAISYMASTFLPFRAGELVRALFLGQRQGLPIPRVAGTILLEKLFDFLAIGVMLLALVLLTPVPSAAVVAGVSIAGTILIGFSFVVGLAIWRGPTLALVGALERLTPFGLGRRVRLEHVVRQFAVGTDSLRETRLWVPLLGWTAVTWVFSIGSIWAGTTAVGLAPGLAALVFVTVLTSTGQAVPSSPGYVGVYHATATLALTAYGVDPAEALGAAVITHAFSYGLLVVAGLVSLWTGGYALSDLAAGVRGPSRVVSPALAPDP